jgi:peptide/nickel transport system substrate-binding protein
MRRQLEAVGIEMELRTNEWGVFFSDIKQGLYDLFTLTAVGVEDPDWYAYVFDSRRMPPDGANRTFYENAEVDRLIEAGRQQTGRAERAVIYRRLQRVTARELPLMPLWSSHNTVVRGHNVHGYVARPDGDFTTLVSTTKTGPR